MSEKNINGHYFVKMVTFCESSISKIIKKKFSVISLRFDSLHSMGAGNKLWFLYVTVTEECFSFFSVNTVKF